MIFIKNITIFLFPLTEDDSSFSRNVLIWNNKLRTSLFSLNMEWSIIQIRQFLDLLDSSKYDNINADFLSSFLVSNFYLKYFGSFAFRQMPYVQNITRIKLEDLNNQIIISFRNLPVTSFDRRVETLL